MTELSPTTHILPIADSVRKMGSIGTLLPNLRARLVRDDETDVADGEPGELWIHGPTVMKGYLNNAAATLDCVTPDGWFKTGDVAIRDGEGFYYIVDRKKELIKYKGFQGVFGGVFGLKMTPLAVPPAELEGVLLTHPEIADAAVIGVEDTIQATELPRAYIVHAAPQNIKTPSARAAFARSVVKWMEGQVARHKFLRGGVVVIDAIPKSAAGKILRRELRELAKRESKRSSALVAVSGINSVGPLALAKL
ncbi:Amp binding protein [Mycena kentingensis (nom. inval.)]|nr:Amp binding protein [Mycena kentingensis (nom. inval.)]